MAGELLSKRAVSPLVATALLVAFSVALGAVVMSWGAEYVAEKAEFVQGVREALSACDSVSFQILRLGGAPQICQRENILEVTIDNGPNAEVYDFNARLVGTAGAYTAETTLLDALRRLHAVKITIPFPKTVGRLQQARLVPKVKVGGDVIFCKSESLTVEAIQRC